MSSAVRGKTRRRGGRIRGRHTSITVKDASEQTKRRGACFPAAASCAVDAGDQYHSDYQGER